MKAYSKELELVKATYMEQGDWGFLTALDLGGCNPSKITSPDIIRSYVKKVCDLIEMKRYGETEIYETNEGLIMFQLIETSNISGVFRKAAKRAHIDIFSCKRYDPQVAEDFTREFFEATECTPHRIRRI
jgi:S-adenosylmethionine/arginine decarboxylase-like enzyme